LPRQNDCVSAPRVQFSSLLLRSYISPPSLSLLPRLSSCDKLLFFPPPPLFGSFYFSHLFKPPQLDPRGFVPLRSRFIVIFPRSGSHILFFSGLARVHLRYRVPSLISGAFVLVHDCRYCIISMALQTQNSFPQMREASPVAMRVICVRLRACARLVGDNLPLPLLTPFPSV